MLASKGEGRGERRVGMSANYKIDVTMRLPLKAQCGSDFNMCRYIEKMSRKLRRGDKEIFNCNKKNLQIWEVYYRTENRAQKYTITSANWNVSHGSCKQVRV